MRGRNSGTHATPLQAPWLISCFRSLSSRNRLKTIAAETQVAHAVVVKSRLFCLLYVLPPPHVAFASANISTCKTRESALVERGSCAYRRISSCAEDSS